jgi:hypothetical protein
MRKFSLFAVVERLLNGWVSLVPYAGIAVVALVFAKKMPAEALWATACAILLAVAAVFVGATTPRTKAIADWLKVAAFGTVVLAGFLCPPVKVGKWVGLVGVVLYTLGTWRRRPH